MQKIIKYFFENRNPLVLVFDIFFLILPGIATLFVMSPDLFEKLDWVKLVLLSSAMITPLIFLNTIAISVIEDIDPSDEKGFVWAFSFATIVSGFAWFVVLGATYLHTGQLHEFLWLLAFGEMVIVGNIWNEKRKEKKLLK